MSDESVVRNWNWTLGVASWLVAAVIAAVCLAYAFDWTIIRTFAGILGIRIGLNLILIGGKDLFEGVTGGGSRTI